MLERSRGARTIVAPAAVVAVVSVVAMTLGFATRSYAQDAKEANDEPSTRSVPRGASGAVIVPPKDADAKNPTPPPQAPQITPPRITKDDGAEYPRAALEAGTYVNVTVELILTVSPEGKVSQVQVAAPTGHPEFEKAASDAARKLELEPARRNGQAIAARIRHKYVFAPPASKLTGKVRSGEDGSPIAGASVIVRSSQGNELRATTDAQGAFEVDELAFGTYRVAISAEGFSVESGDEILKPGEEVQMKVRLSRLAPSPAAKPAASDIEEVRVVGTRPPREVTRRTLEQRELSRIPGTSGDALRALQNLPGVARPPGLAGLLIVRGSNPQDTNIFADGTLIPIAYHFGGLSSVIPTELLERIDFYPGNFSTQYGRVMGGIVDIGIRDPKKDGKFHGLGQLDLIDGRVLLEGPIANTGWNFLAAGRRSYVDVWLKPALERADVGVVSAPVYYDFQLLAQRDFDKDTNVRIGFFGSDDRLEIVSSTVSASQPGFTGVAFHTGFWRLQGRYRKRFSSGTEFKILGAVGRDFIDFDLGEFLLKLDTYPISSRMELSQKMAPGLTMNVGMDWLYTPYDVRARFPALPRPGEPPNAPFLSLPPRETAEEGTLYRPALYTEFEVTPFKGTRLVPGVRLDYTRDTKSWDVSPRFNGRQEIVSTFPKTTLKGGIGTFYQPPQPQETNPVLGQLGLRNNRALHYSIGGEQDITKNLEVSLEGFYKQLDYLVVPRAGNEGRGKAYGLELLLRYKPDARFFGWLAYTLSESLRQDTETSPVRRSPFSQTHILTVLGSYRLGRGWEIGGRFRLVSGNLVSPQNYGFYDQNTGVYLPLLAYPPFTERLPMFHQLDIRVDKVWKFRAWQMSVYADIYNIYNNANVEGVNRNYNQTQQSYTSGLPILPSIGVRGEF